MTEFTDTSLVVAAGMMDYRTAWALQKQIADARAADRLPDVLLLLEHPHTYTLGRGADTGNLLLDEAERAARQVDLVAIDRGGDITYHGPGQLVAYPIRYLGRADPSGRLVRTDYVGFLRRLEDTLIDTLGAFGITARQEAGYTGVWVDTPAGPEKAAAIGVHVSAKGISTHGTALNVTTDLSYFDGIIPCGIHDRGVTSLQKLLGEACPTMAEVEGVFSRVFGEVFGCKMQRVTLAALQEAI